jgi:hypothetical protein
MTTMLRDSDSSPYCMLYLCWQSWTQLNFFLSLTRAAGILVRIRLVFACLLTCFSELQPAAVIQGPIGSSEPSSVINN